MSVLSTYNFEIKLERTTLNFHHRCSRAETRYKYEVLSEEKDSCTKPGVLREPATQDLADETTLCVSRTGSREQDS